MQDIKLREAFRALVRHLNLRVDDYYDYGVRNSPPGSDCNIARKGDIQDLQDQIDILKKVKKKK